MKLASGETTIHADFIQRTMNVEEVGGGGVSQRDRESF